MLNKHGKQMKTLILVDLDNFNSPHQISTILTFYTKDTKFEFFGLKSQNKKKIARIREAFRGKNLNEFVNFNLLGEIVPDGADLKMFGFVGENMASWDMDSLENIIICSNDNMVSSLAVLLSRQYRTWIIRDDSTMGKSNVLKSSSRLKMNVPIIRIKTPKRL